MAASGYLIRYSTAQGSWQDYRPVRDEVVLGRSPDCDLPLEAVNISRHHARLQFTPQGIFLTDLGSTNGTQIEGAPIPPRRPVVLAPGQNFSVGSFLIQVVALQAAPAHPGLPQAAMPGSATQVAPQMTPPAPVPAGPPRAVPPARPPQAVYPAQPVQPLAAAPVEAVETKTMYRGEVEGQQLPMSAYNLDLSAQTKISIGRAPDNTMVLNHPMCSRYHAEIERVGARVQLRDLHAVNGVFVNNERIEREVWLKDGDRIQIGPYIFGMSGLSIRQQTDAGLTLETFNINKFVSAKLNLLKNISLRIKPMEFVAVVGMSGSGKTTLLNVLSGYSPATDGKVTINGTDLYKHYDQFRNDMGYVPQKGHRSR